LKDLENSPNLAPCQSVRRHMIKHTFGHFAVQWALGLRMRHLLLYIITRLNIVH